MNEREVFQLVSQTNIENWYEDLKDYTFESVFLTISVEEATALKHAIEQWKGKVELTRQEQSTISSIQKRLEIEVQKFRTKDKYVFVRLSTRSPKDSDILSERSEESYQRFLKESDKSKNSQVIARIRSGIHSLKVASGSEALDILRHSDRVLLDLTEALDLSEQFNMAVILREWIDVPIQMEFRGFVRNRTLTALSQYYHYVYFPELESMKDEIQHKIFDFFEAVKDKIPLESCIMDFILIDDQVRIVELNPFVFGTEAGLFSWKSDQEILEKGPFEFRIRTEPVE